MVPMITVGVAQLGPISRYVSRASVIARLLDHLLAAAAKGCDLVVFPELALTTSFPRWVYEDEADLDDYCETEMLSLATQTDAQSVVHGVSVLDGITVAVSELEGRLR